MILFLLSLDVGFEPPTDSLTTSPLNHNLKCSVYLICFCQNVFVWTLIEFYLQSLLQALVSKITIVIFSSNRPLTNLKLITGMPARDSVRQVAATYLGRWWEICHPSQILHHTAAFNEVKHKIFTQMTKHESVVMKHFDAGGEVLTTSGQC